MKLLPQSHVRHSSTKLWLLGLKVHIEKLQLRMARLSERAAERRQIARDTMMEVDLKSIKAPDFTLSLRTGSPALIVVDESVIPEFYWEARDPCLNRFQLLTDLKRGASIPGAQLSNPEPVLTVRVR